MFLCRRCSVCVCHACTVPCRWHVPLLCLCGGWHGITSAPRARRACAQESRAVRETGLVWGNARVCRCVCVCVFAYTCRPCRYQRRSIGRTQHTWLEWVGGGGCQAWAGPGWGYGLSPASVITHWYGLVVFVVWIIECQHRAGADSRQSLPSHRSRVPVHRVFVTVFTHHNDCSSPC